MADPVDDPDEWSARDARGPRRASPPSPVTAVVVAAAGYEVAAITVNAFLDAEVLPSLTTWLTKPWSPAVKRQAVSSGRWVVISGAVVTGIALLAVGQRRAQRRARRR
jgi:hypothetical protein